MDSGSDKYLHKKFKKQLSVAESPKPQYDNEQEAKTTLPCIQEKSASQKFLVVECPKTSFEDNKDSVPNQSTNRRITSPLLVTTATTTTAPCVRSVYSSSISKVDEETCESESTTNNPPQSTITCISYGNATADSRPSSDHTETVRPFSFDRKFSVSEPNVDDTRTDQSSILENPNYVSAKLNIIEKDENHYEKDHYHEEPSSFLDKTRKPSGAGDSQENNPLSDKTSSGKHVCPYCSLACSKPSVLQKHIRAHTNERPYPCDSCGFSFKTRSNLYKHCRSRTHANRVMGNKLQEIVTEMEVENNSGTKSPTNPDEKMEVVLENSTDRSCPEQKSKPYKPRFHTAKAFFDAISKENLNDNEKLTTDTPNNIKRPNSDLLSIRINEVISKNNSIVNSTDPYLLKRRSIDNSAYQDNNNELTRYIYNNTEQKTTDEPLNLTNKNRKRCLSEVITEPAAQKSLIKELLLKNLYADTNMQCAHCKMIFQTVTELELHKLRSCKGFTKSSARYNRSSSVNVASILTQNKNAFDSLAFPLKSPGPFLGKTRLVESDKNKSFSFDDNLAQTSLNSLPSGSDFLRTASQRYALSPLTIQSDKEKKPPVRLFGGEVKIAHTSGETKSFKIDSKEDQFCGGGGGDNYLEYAGKLSENRVVKSTLQSGGTVLTNKPAHTKQDSLRNSPDVIRVYENNSSATPKIELGADKGKFNFDNQAARDMIVEQNKNFHPILIRSVPETSGGLTSPNSYKYTNIVDFSQKAAKLLQPNIKQFNLAVPGLPVPSKLAVPVSALITEPQMVDRSYELKSATQMDVDFVQNYSQKEADVDRRNLEFAEKQILLQQKMSVEPPQTQQLPLCNPVNLLVNGKVVRYVPGIPGPIADAPLDMAYSSNIISTNRAIPPATAMRLQKPNLVLSPLEPIAISPVKKLPVIIENHATIATTIENLHTTEITTTSSNLDRQKLSPNNNKITEPSPPPPPSSTKSPNPEMGPPTTTTTVEPRKFMRPNSLALKPSLAAMKTHHGLTPTVFNQVLISPDTPRVAKKYNQHMIHGNYFTYLGLKSSTKSVYCTLNKTQPVYVPHFKKLSMYSEWRQQENKSEKLYVSGYDSRQRHGRCTVAGRTELTVVHSSYKYAASELDGKSEEKKNSSIVGGYESNEDYTYVRGRGRGRFVCDQCGIRCKKPSMLKKHIRTHSNERPYTCTHCNFSFKTKGNLTKHMKSKSHTKNYYYVQNSASNGSSSSSKLSESDESDESEMEMSSDESTRQQEHEAAYGLLSLSQKTSPGGLSPFTQNDFMSATSPCQRNSPTTPLSESTGFIDNEELVHVSKKNFAKNKILDQQAVLNFNAKQLSELPRVSESDGDDSQSQTLKFLGKTNVNRPLTFPYTSPVSESRAKELAAASKNELKCIRHFQVIQNYNQESQSPKKIEIKNSISPTTTNYADAAVSPKRSPQIVPIVKVNDKMVLNNVPADLRKRKVSSSSSSENVLHKPKIQRNDGEVMDLSVPEKRKSPDDNVRKYNGTIIDAHHPQHFSAIYTRNHHNVADTNLKKVNNDVFTNLKKNFEQLSIPNIQIYSDNNSDGGGGGGGDYYPTRMGFGAKPIQNDENNCVSINYMIEPRFAPQSEYDNSAMETLADIATKQVKLEKNSVAKNVATEFLKLATKNEFAGSDGGCLQESGGVGGGGGGFGPVGKKVNDLMVKPEENKSCTICAKSFSKPSHLKLHMNIHYLERPFRCDSCSVGFRTKGQLQKHERSAGHHNKLSSSPALSSSEPRPFKCTDCNIAFRIHGHLAKHLRSKMHIMKLECLAKIPFGLYAELERSNSLLTEINTADGDQCLDSLKTLAKKVFMNDPNKLNQLEVASEQDDVDS